MSLIECIPNQYEGILKPAYNAIDMLELELLDDGSEPREFSASLLKVWHLFVGWFFFRKYFFIRLTHSKNVICLYRLGSQRNH